MSKEKVCAVVGVGPRNGLAPARRFAASGEKIALLARRDEVLARFSVQVEGSLAVPCDVTDLDAVDVRSSATLSW